MNRKDKLEKLAEIKPETALHQVVMELLSKMGFQQIQHTHKSGRPEYGKDIVAALPNVVAGLDWHAFVVKAERVAGNSRVIEDIKAQVRQCFEYPHLDLNGSALLINKTVVLSSANITSGAEEALRSSDIVASEANVFFWKAERVVDLLDEHYPEFWQPEEPMVRDYCSRTKAALLNEHDLHGLSLEQGDKRTQKLLDVFVEPTLVEQIIDRAAQAKGHPAITQQRLRLSHIIDAKDNFLLTGQPGCGKSRLVSSVAHHLLDPTIAVERKTLPIRISVNKLRDHGFDLARTVDAELQDIIPEYIDQFRHQEYAKLLLIDSVDFLSASEKTKLLTELGAYLEEHQGRFIHAARLSDGFELDTHGLEMRTVRVQNLDPQQVELFITRYFRKSEQASRLIEVLRDSNLFDKIPTTPLTLTLISLLYEDGEREIPATQADIYADFTDVLLGKLEVRSRQELMSLHVKRRCIAVVALEMLHASTYEWSLEDFGIRVNRFLSQKGYEQQEPDAVRAIVEHSGFMYVDSNSRIGFKHLSFLEYFAASEIYDHRRKEFYSELLHRFADPTWQGVSIFFAGRSKDMPEFVNDLLESLNPASGSERTVVLSGLGYLAQALYMTDLDYKKQLVRRALDEFDPLFQELREWTADKNNPLSRAPLYIVAGFVSYWFTINFKSVTLASALEEVFSEMAAEEASQDPTDTVRSLKLFALASTLAHRHIHRWNSLNRLIELQGVMKNPLAIILLELFLDSEVDDNDPVSGALRDRIERLKNSYRSIILRLAQSPAYRFDDHLKQLPPRGDRV